MPTSRKHEFETFDGLLRERARLHPERLVFKFLADSDPAEIDLTYGELDRQARAVAAVLQQRGLGNGQRALLFYPPSLSFISAFFGCLYAGVVPVPAYPPHPAGLHRILGRLQAIASNAEPTAALTTTPLLTKMGALFEQAPDFAALEWLASDTVDAEMADQWTQPDPPATGETLAFLQYTSGSTAMPKGVEVTHANILANENCIDLGFTLPDEGPVVGWLPFHHDMGLIGNLFQPIYRGGSAVLMAPVSFLQRPVRWFEAISRYGGHSAGGPNFAFDLCVRKITADQKAQLDLSNWTLAFCGSEPIRAETLEAFAEAFAECGFRRESLSPCYGMAEATLMVTTTARGVPPATVDVNPDALTAHRVVTDLEPGAARRTLMSSGTVWGPQRVEIVDAESRRVCPPDQVGEIWVQGPSVARGYWRQPEETERTFRAHLADSGDGPFLRTGDLGFMRDGHLFVTGRLKDVVIIDGRNHYPQDIELTIEQSHPAVINGGCVAFGVDIDGRERLVVVAEVDRQYRPEQNANGAGLVSDIQRAVAAQHDIRPHAVSLVRIGGVPRTSSGKVQRRACRSKFLDGTLDLWGTNINTREGVQL
jgi:acyl-CoA synthetase (AMP-forming)/AMP-acid ligase II